MKLNKIFKNFKKDFPAYLIAEVAQAHDGSIGFAHSFIDLAASLKFDAVKFQVHIASQESSKQDKFRKKFSYLDETRYQYWERMEFTLDQWKSLKHHAEKLGLDFICSVFSNKAFELMQKINLKIWKIASGELFNDELLIKIAKQKAAVIVSNGMSDFKQTKKQINKIRKYNNKLILLHCNSIYPTPAKDVNLRQIKKLKSIFNFPIGYSDHTGNPYSAISAIVFGANVIELHLCFNKFQHGPDTSSSLTPEEFEIVSNSNKFIFQFLGNSKSNKKNQQPIKKITQLFKKSVGVNKNLNKGHLLKKTDLILKKPGTGIKPEDLQKCVGKKLKRKINSNEILNYKDIIK